MKILNVLLTVAVLAVGAAQAQPITLFEDSAVSEFGAPGALSSDTPFSGAEMWRVDYGAFESHGFVLQDGQASLSQIVDNPVSLWYRTQSAPQGQVNFNIGTFDGGVVTLTDQVIVTLENDGEWHNLTLDFSDAGSGLDPDVPRELRLRAQNWLTAGTSQSDPRAVDYDLVVVVPEPATMALLGIGAGVLLHRRRR